MKNVLLVSYSYPPSQAPAAQRPFYLAKYIDKSKWNVFVLTPKVSDSSMGHSDNIENIESVQIIYTGNINISSLRKLKDEKKVDKSAKKSSFVSVCKKKIYHFISSITIPDKGVIWVPFALFKAYKTVKQNKIDIVFTTSPLFSNHIVGMVLKKLLKVKWVADFRDFHYIENYEKTSLLRRHLDRWLERKVIHLADKVLFIAESMKDEYTINYEELTNKGYAVYNGFELEKNLKVETIDKDTPLTIFYAGSFYSGERSPFPLLKSLDKLIDGGKISIDQIKIKIAGNIDQKLIVEMRKYKVFKSIEFLGLISRKQVLNEIRIAHLLWLIVGSAKNHYMGFPIKGYEYIDAQRNILAFVPRGSEADHIISTYNLGFVLPNNQSDESSKNNVAIIQNIIEQYQRGNLNKPLELQGDILSLSKKSQFKKIEDIFNLLVQ